MIGGVILIHIVPATFIAILLGLGVLDMPYAYYTFLRYVMFIYSLSYAGMSYSYKKIGILVAFIAIAILFNPIVEIHLTKDVWVFIDIAVAILYFSVGIYFYSYCKKRNIDEAAHCAKIEGTDSTN